VQPVVATPDRLQEHLAKIFPDSYQPASLSGEFTRFSNFRRGLQRGRARERWWSRLWRGLRSAPAAPDGAGGASSA
jgi:hypothetical protein